MSAFYDRAYLYMTWQPYVTTKVWQWCDIPTPNVAFSYYYLFCCWTLTVTYKSKFLSLTYHADTEGELYCFFNLGTRYGWVVNATPWALYHCGINRYPFYRRLVGPQDRHRKSYLYRDSILGTSSAQWVAIPAMQSRTLTVIYIGNYSVGRAFGSEHLGVGTKRLHRSDDVSGDEILSAAI
jgi:hypothetical protein